MRRTALFWVLMATMSSAAAQDGAALFRSKCTACHDEAKVMAGVRKIEAAERPERLEQRLASHFAPDPAAREKIIEYLVKAAGQ
ncbi:MAG: hypothetical protein IT532_12000 [Burkholderiales bacterium]|nr:hypothetical protein [Burkholderiales bacterium]